MVEARVEARRGLLDVASALPAGGISMWLLFVTVFLCGQGVVPDHYTDLRARHCEIPPACPVEDVNSGD
jgi:hypothetical protein